MLENFSKIGDIKAQLKTISDCPLAQYQKEMEELQEFIELYCEDERAGVLTVLKSAEKKLNFFISEVKRVEAMKEFEKKYAEEGYSCGVDEVGRGPLAGPIVTAAVILPIDFTMPYMNDSKQVTEAHREELYDIIMENAVAVAFGEYSEKVIDQIGVGKADSKAMEDAVRNLAVKPSTILVDAFRIPGIEDIKQVPIIKGDTKSISIAAASIVAKVKRDRFMKEMDEKYPEYGFAKNKGYGSKDHIDALHKIGPCEIHRMSFLGSILGGK